jgi:hypothetical protein
MRTRAVKTKLVEIEADTLDDVQEKINAQASNEQHILGEKRLRGGDPEWVSAYSDILELAHEQARKKIPKKAIIVTEKEESLPVHKILEIGAIDETSAMLMAEEMVRRDRGRIEKIHLKEKGRQGFLGIGKKLPIYSVEVFQPAVVVIWYRSPYKFQLILGKLPLKAYCQMCGKSGAEIFMSDNSQHYFCSLDCKDYYFNMEIEARAANRTAMQASFGILKYEIGGLESNLGVQGIAESMVSSSKKFLQANVHCWLCGTENPIIENSCKSCGVDQGIKSQQDESSLLTENSD